LPFAQERQETQDDLIDLKDLDIQDVGKDIMKNFALKDGYHEANTKKIGQRDVFEVMNDPKVLQDFGVTKQPFVGSHDNRHSLGSTQTSFFSNPSQPPFQQQPPPPPGHFSTVNPAATHNNMPF